MPDFIDDLIAARAVVKEGEAPEPLGGGYVVIQPIDGYRFGSDALWLARFAGSNIARGAEALDLCSGCGVIGMLLCIEKEAHVIGAELDEALCDMSNRASYANNIDARFINVNLNSTEIRDVLGYHLYDAVVCNPPYFKAESKHTKIAPHANSELTIDFERIAFVASNALKMGGKFFFTHTLTRLDEIICTCVDHDLRIKKLVINKSRKTFGAMCTLGGKAGMTVEVE
ncbi:MAG: methyltransferase [Clostridiales bacterium]|nr:methyltransferase [Clostridiales bacterium]